MPHMKPDPAFRAWVVCSRLLIQENEGDEDRTRSKQVCAIGKLRMNDHFPSDQWPVSQVYGRTAREGSRVEPEHLDFASAAFGSRLPISR